MDHFAVPEPDDVEGRIASTTVTSFRVIEALQSRDGAGVTELAEELSLGKGTVHKHLNTLREIEYVVKENGKYRLSLGFLGLGASVRARMQLYETSHEPLEKLAEATGEVASVMIPEHGWGIYLTRVSSSNEAPTELHEGERVPLTATAGGKAILAYVPDEKRERLFDEYGLPKLTENTITDRETLREELRKIHDDRIAYDRGELDLEQHCVAAPITDADNTAVGAVTVSGPADRMREKAVDLDFPSIIGSTTNSIRNRFVG